MFKFDFVQDGGEQTQGVQDEKKEPNEPVLTEISLIELVRTPRLNLFETAMLILFTVGHFALPHLLLSAADTATREPSRNFYLSAGPL